MKYLDRTFTVPMSNPARRTRPAPPPVRPALHWTEVQPDGRRVCLDCQAVDPPGDQTCPARA